MPTVNVNMFQEGINNSEYLTQYTDQYLKQSLANLGQRMSIKGDSIYSGSFQIKDLFPKYLDDWSKPGLCAIFTIETDDDGISKLSGAIKQFKQYFKNDKEYWKFKELENSQYSETQLNELPITPIIKDVYKEGGFDYEALQLLNGLNIINDTIYWKGEKAYIEKQHNGYLYKTRAVNNDLGEPQTFEDVFEYVSNKGELLDGLRVFLINNYIVFINVFLSADDNYFLRFFVLSEENPIEYKEESNNILDNLYEYLAAQDPEIYDENIKINSLPKNIYDYILSNENFEKIYIYENPEDHNQLCEINYNTEKNQFLSLKDRNEIAKQLPEYLKDLNIDRRILTFFNNDVANLFPLTQETYNKIKFEAETNEKVYGNILGNLLIGPVYKDLLIQRDKYSTNGETGEISRFEILFPVDFEISYNVNSNNPNLIYNSITNTSIQYVNSQNSTEDDIEDNIVIDYLQQISNIRLDASNNPLNNNTGIILGYETKTVLYEFSITYLKETLINRIVWFQSFSLPYINSQGFWNINGIDTEVYAYGRDSQKTNFVVLLSRLNNPEYATVEYSDDAQIISEIISSPYQINKLIDKDEKSDKYISVLENWNTLPIKLPYLNNVERDVIDESDIYILQACMPSEKFINEELIGSNDFEYLKNTIFINLISPTTEKDLWNLKYSIEREATGYVPYFDKDSNQILWGIFERRPGTLVSKIGTEGVMTTFWTLEYNEKENKYQFKYLSRPENKNIGLDLTYLTNIDNLIKFHINNNLEPDKYEHSWLVFDEVNRNYKNTLSDANNSVWPTIKNNDVDDYASFFDTSYSFNNPSNIGVSFSNVDKDVSGMILGIDDSSKNIHWKTTTDVKIDRVPKDPADYFQNFGKDVADDQIFNMVYTYLNHIEGGIRYRDPYTYEYIPNPNIDDTKTIFPYLDLSEVLVKDETVINRVNILSTAPMSYNTKTIWPLYYTYIGTSFEDEDKSIVHVGTSYMNPNLGTRTQVDDRTKQNLTLSKKISIDFEEIELNGNVSVTGNFQNSKNIWKKNEFEIDEDEKITTFSSIINPIGKHELKKLEAKDNLCYSYIGVIEESQGNVLVSYIYGNTKIEEQEYINRVSPITTEDPNSPLYKAKNNHYQSWIFNKNNQFSPEDNDNLFTTIEFIPDENISNATRYYTTSDPVRISYLNVNELLRQEGIYQKTYMTVYSNCPLTYFTYVDNEHPHEGNYNTYFLELSSDLSNNENLLAPTNKENLDIRICNPIQISYTKSISPIEVVTFRDNIKNMATYLYPLSYTEHWSCSGCEFCNNPENCPMMKICNNGVSCEGWITGWEYGQIEADKTDTIKPNKFKVSRTVPITYYDYDADGDLIQEETTYHNIEIDLPFPNFNIRRKDTLTRNPSYNLTEGEYGYDEYSSYKYYYCLFGIDDKDYRVYTSYSDHPERWQDTFTSRIDFEPEQFNTYTLLNDMYRDTSYEMKENGTISYNDNNGNSGYILFTYSYPEFEEVEVPGLAPHTYFKYKGMSEPVSIPVSYSFEYSDDQNRIEEATYCYNLTVNIRELISTHSDPRYYNGISSLDAPNNPDSTLGTNKYK
ncbi:MAG: hypothetical protein J1F35_06365 [Erysipelotrichales bacterium]|nr:hypothetical protein [Erysipelotrichales bacterium]